MCKMLLSINPNYVKRIFEGDKKYEFRKQRCKQPVNRIIIYATSPVSQVVGEVGITDIIEDTPEKVWKQTFKYAGISKSFFDSYYEGKSKAVAYKLGNIEKYESPLNLSDLGLAFAPQSFVYI